MSEKLKFDCGNKNEDCDNATICPCLLFINKQLDSYEKVLQSDIFREATKYEYRCDNEQCGNIEYLRG